MKITPFTTMPGVEGGPTFSPDGTRIAFHHSSGAEDSPDSRIMVKLIGVILLRSSRMGRRQQSCLVPGWSMDSVHAQRRGAQRAVSRFSLGGPEWRVSSTRGCSAPGWSPDSRTLAFGGATTFGGCVGLYVVSLDNLDTRPLTEPIGTQGWDWCPRVLTGRPHDCVRPLSRGIRQRHLCHASDGRRTETGDIR